METRGEKKLALWHSNKGAGILRFNRLSSCFTYFSKGFAIFTSPIRWPSSSTHGWTWWYSLWAGGPSRMSPVNFYTSRPTWSWVSRCHTDIHMVSCTFAECTINSILSLIFFCCFLGKKWEDLPFRTCACLYSSSLRSLQIFRFPVRSFSAWKPFYCLILVKEQDTLQASRGVKHWWLSAVRLPNKGQFKKGWLNFGEICPSAAIKSSLYNLTGENVVA